MIIYNLVRNTGTYGGIGTKCVESENIMKSTHTHKKNLVRNNTMVMSRQVP